MAARRLFIIDAMALAFRSFYALGRSGGLSTSQGMPTGAIYGAALFLNKLVTEQRPDYLVAVTDAGGGTFRHELYKDYKATRDRMPEDLAKQLPHVMELFPRFKMKLLSIPGVEADDVIATLARRDAGEDLDVFIVSGDKDFCQLVDGHTFLYAPKKNEEPQIIDRDGVLEKLGCTPEQVVDLLALVGDAVDNVPGVKGIGEKGAAKLLEAYGSLDGVYAHLGEITAKKQREGLEACRDDAYLSQRLVTLKTDVPVPLALEDLRCDPAEAAANPDLLGFLKKFELKSLATKVEAALKKRPGPVPTGLPADEPETMGIDVGEVADTRPLTEVTTPSAQAALREAFQGAPSLGLALVATGRDVVADKATSLVFATDAERFSLPLTEEGIYVARTLLGRPGPQLLIHDLKHADEMLRNVGLRLPAGTVDLQICDYLLDPNNYDHSLKAMSGKYLGTTAVASGAPADASLALALGAAVLPRIESQELGRVLREIELPLVPVLAAMEREGVYVDPEALAVYSDELALLAARLQTELYAAAGGEFNVNSPKQLQELLYEKLKLQDAAGLKRVKKTKTGLSTDESVLSQLADVHPVPRLILEYRTVTKLKNTYVDPLPQYISPKTSRVHTSFNQTVAATGRLSCDRPNLQNIPMRTEMGRRIRSAFRPQRPGDVIISADYSQVELRLLAHLAKADGLIEAFRRGLDIHTVTAAKIFGLKESEVTPLLRSRAKAVNFGIIYGMGPQRLAAETGTSLAEAKDFIQRYFEVYPGIRDYTESLIEQARTKGYGVTIYGRRRPIPEIRDQSQVMAARGENIAVNAPIQGSAADLVKLAMIHVAAELQRRRLKARMVLQVHDELVFTAPADEAAEVMELVRDKMEHALETSVPLKVDVRSGADWLAAHS